MAANSVHADRKHKHITKILNVFSYFVHNKHEMRVSLIHWKNYFFRDIKINFFWLQFEISSVAQNFFFFVMTWFFHICYDVVYLNLYFANKNNNKKRHLYFCILTRLVKHKENMPLWTCKRMRWKIYIINLPIWLLCVLQSFLIRMSINICFLWS